MRIRNGKLKGKSKLEMKDTQRRKGILRGKRKFRRRRRRRRKEIKSNK
jgi:hypothetical protein